MTGVLKQARGIHRRMLEQLYEDTCSVYELATEKNPVTKRAEQSERNIAADIPCRISFETAEPTVTSGNVAEKSVSVKLFLAPEVQIRAGSKLMVTHMGETTAYSSSGVPKLFPTHQEIELKLFERWV